MKDDISLLKDWVADARAMVASGKASLTVADDSPLEGSLEVPIGEMDADDSIAFAEAVKGYLGESSVLVRGDMLRWNVISPESVRHWKSVYGDMMTYGMLSSIREDPESHHSVNAAYSMGIKYLMDTVLDKEREFGMDSPSP